MSSLLASNLFSAKVLTFTFDPAAVGAATSAEQTTTVKGLKVGDVPILVKPTATAGVGIVNCRVSAADTLAVTFMNATAGSLDPASETYTLLVFRPQVAGTDATM